MNDKSIIIFNYPLKPLTIKDFIRVWEDKQELKLILMELSDDIKAGKAVFLP